MMRVLIDHGLPFAFAHGGHRTQVEQTRLGLAAAGAEVEWMRWWDPAQAADVLHVFAPAEISYLRTAREQERKIVLTSLLTAECNQPPSRWRTKRAKLALFDRLPGFGGVNATLPWKVFDLVALNIVGLEIEARVLREAYGVPAERVAVVPLGLSDAYLRQPPAVSDRTNAPCLVCTGTITARKRTNDLARLARRAQVPILFVGKGYRPDDPYFLEFQSLVDGKFVRHVGHVESEAEMIELYLAARGFVIFSEIENWCLSAHEAAACGLPVLLRPLPWAHERFGDQATYFAGEPVADAAVLRRFYEVAATAPAPKVRQWSWAEVGALLLDAYRGAR